MPEQDIYKLVEQLNKNKSVSKDQKINDIYNMLDEVKSGVEKPHLTLDSDNKKEKVSTLKDFKDQAKPIVKPSFPSMIRPFDKRSDCFINIIQAVEYGDNNPIYKEGHENALEKYYSIASNNNRDFYVIEAQLNEEIDKYQKMYRDDLYTKGYFDGLQYVFEAVDRSKQLIAKKINDQLMKELR